jgi:hypothetical protein
MQADKPKGRGLGKKPRMVCTSIRLDKVTRDFYKTNYGSNMQSKMREVLTEHLEILKSVENYFATIENIDENTDTGL